jgi:hypothetical protein
MGMRRDACWFDFFGAKKQIQEPHVRPLRALNMGHSRKVLRMKFSG